MPNTPSTQAAHRLAVSFIYAEIMAQDSARIIRNDPISYVANWSEDEGSVLVNTRGWLRWYDRNGLKGVS